MLSVQGGRVTRYVFLSEPSELIPFTGNFPILQEYQKTAFYEEIQQHMYLEECSDWVQEAVLKGDDIYLIETGFKNYLRKHDIGEEEYIGMDAGEKQRILYDFLDDSSLGRERLNIR